MSQKKTKFLLISRKNPTAFKIREELEKNSDYVVFLEETAAAAMKMMSQGQIDCLIFNFEIFDVAQVRILQDVREVGHKFPILGFADHITHMANDLFTKIENATIFEKVLIDMDQDIAGLCSRFSQTPIASRRSKRHPTKEKAKIQNSSTGEIIEGTICNLSDGGAYVEVNSSSLVLGQKVKVIIDLKKLNKLHKVAGHIMWVKSSPNGRRSVGVQFVKPTVFEKAS